ncbi:WecB/TagA/CpsF family glycosyltransferase [Thermopirellula anaerolimosa]
MNNSYEFSNGAILQDTSGYPSGQCAVELPPKISATQSAVTPRDATDAPETGVKRESTGENSAVSPVPIVEVFGLPIARWTFDETVAAVERLIESGKPSYFITANLHYARLCHRNQALADVNRRAAFLVADGMPLIWWSRWQGTPLPERVTGADLVWALAEAASRRQYRVFLLGGRPGVADRAASVLQERFPGLVICGTAAPQIDRLTRDEEQALLDTIAESEAQLVFAALGQPKGELWLARNLGRWGTATAVQIGASLDFIAGTLRRAPRIWQRMGLEWAYRLITEPRRLLPRYSADAWFLLRAVLKGSLRKRR